MCGPCVGRLVDCNVWMYVTSVRQAFAMCVCGHSGIQKPSGQAEWICNVSESIVFGRFVCLKVSGEFLEERIAFKTFLNLEKK